VIVSEVHPVVGSWRVAVAVGNVSGLTNLATLNADGTVVVVFPSPTPAAPGAAHRLEYWTPAIGSWAASGASTATMTFVALGADENGVAIGTHTVRATVAAGNDGWHGPFTIEIAAPDGTVQATVSGPVTATPIVAEGHPESTH
jgi:hypothetical protein